MDTTTIRSRVYHGGICLLLSVACAFSIIPSQSEAARFPEVGASFLAEREQAGSSRVRRLQEFSDRTDAVGYLNADGSKTVYIYAEDVRYRDKNGTVIDKNIHLTEDTAQDRAGGGYRYRTAANDITAYYPERLSNDGVTWEYNGHRIALWPQGDGTSVVALEQDNTRAVYQTASGKIAFDSILSGTRLSQTVDADATAVTMAADFGDLTPRVEQNTISLVDVAGKEQLRFESLNLTDEDGNNSEALILSLTPKTDGKYSLSIDLDEEFVSVADSAVMLNASLTVSSSSNIISASVYSGAPTTNYGSQTYNRIGYDWDSSPSKGFARTYVKFDLSALSNIRYDNITSACYRFTEGSSADVTAVMEAYLVTNSWNESTITWNNKPDYYGEEALAKININSAVNESQYDLYITKAVQGWLQGLNNYGLLLKEKEDYQWQSFFSEEFPTSTIAPSLVITYVDEAAPTQAPGVEDGGTYYLLNKKSGKYLAAAGTTAGSYATEDDSVAIAQKVWTVEQQTNGYYTLKNNGLALQATGATAGISVKVQTASATAPRQHWAIARNWDGSYRLINQFGQSQDLCLSGGSSTNGTYTRVQVYTVNLDGADDWTLVPTNKGNTSILYDSIMWEDEGSEYHMNILRQSISNMISYSNSLGYNATRCDDKTTSEALELMHNSSIWVATGHGSKSSQQISKIKQSFVNYSNLPSSLNHLLLVLYRGCSVGASNGNINLTGLTYKNGAHYVMSFPKDVYSWACSDWNRELFFGMSLGYTLGEAKEHADDWLYENDNTVYGNMNMRHDLGDNSIRFDLPISSSNSLSSKTISLTSSTLGEFVSEENRLLSKIESLQQVTGLETDIEGNTYTLYKDALDNAYVVSGSTNILKFYLPSNNNLNLGDAVVDSQAALQQAKLFLDSSGYDVTGFTMTCSNEFSKKFKITYQYKINNVDTAEKLTFIFKAEENGTVHLTRFAAYNYGMFSAPNSPSIVEDDYTKLLSSLTKSAIAKADSSNYMLSDPIWYRNRNGDVQLQAHLYFKNESRPPQTVYSNILR